jgi:hypothetical protein
MTPDEYRDAIARLGLSQVGAGRVLGVSPRTAQRFAVEGPTGPAARLMAVLLEMNPGERGNWIQRFKSTPTE